MLALPDSLFEPFVQRTLVIVAVVVLQDMLDVVGSRQQIAVVRPDLQVDHITESIGRLLKHADRI